MGLKQVVDNGGAHTGVRHTLLLSSSHAVSDEAISTSSRELADRCCPDCSDISGVGKDFAAVIGFCCGCVAVGSTATMHAAALAVVAEFVEVATATEASSVRGASAPAFER